jgi:hypothetical protein
LRNYAFYRLSLDWCHLGDTYEGIKVFFVALGQNDTLEILSMTNNALMPSMGKTLATSGLKLNISLRYVDLSWNKIGDTGAIAILEMLKINKTVHKIILEGNGVSGSVYGAVEAHLHHNVQLHFKVS